MFFKRKSKSTLKCNECKSNIDKNWSFCPHCGTPQAELEKEIREYGLLGKNDALLKQQAQADELTMTDKLVGTLVSSLMKSLDKQFKELEKAEVSQTPQGIRIKVGSSQAQTKKEMPKKTITDEQMKRISSLPRVAAKTKIKRLSDKILYELETPGVISGEDIFVSKLESGYEIKALGDKKIYVNSLPIDLPLKNLTVSKDKLLVEFNSK